MPKAQMIEPVQSMTREEYRAWLEHQPTGLFERIDGVVVAMAPERVEHNDRKMLAWLALRRAIRDAGVPCHVHGDGMTVGVGDSDRQQIVHHRRDDAGAIATTLLTGGEIRLDPPGIAVGVEEIYAD